MAAVALPRRQMTRVSLVVHHFGRESRVSVPPFSNPGRQIATVARPPDPGLDGGLRAVAEQRRYFHVPNLAGRCRVDGQPHPCYDFAAAGVVLSVVAGSAPSPRLTSTRAGVTLAVTMVAAVALLAAVWLLWVR